MKKRFVAKRRRKVKIHFKFRYLIYLLLLYLGYQLLAGFLIKFQLTNNNEDFLRALMNDSNHYMLYEKDNKTLLTKATKWLTGMNLKEPAQILDHTLHYTDNHQKPVSDVLESTGAETATTSDQTKYIKDPVKESVNAPRVYIYNTHQLEGYSMKNLEAYNITPNVMMASYLLREKLKEKNIEALVEETNVNEYMATNNWQIKDPYQVTKTLMTQTLTSYPDLDLLIDLHRDAVTKDASTIEIQGTAYAKILFVVGLDHDNYQKNLDLATKINDMVNQKYPNLSRGILKKQGSSVNGIYNQDVSPKAILIECGGYENTIDEVSNTIVALADVLSEYLGGIGNAETGR